MASKHDGDAAALPGEATEWRWALAVFLLLDLALFAPVLLSGADRGLGWADGDLPRMFVPWRLWAKQRLLAGELPLWNPHIFAGLPYLAGFQGAIFYPPNALYLLPLGMAISLSRFLHTLLGQFGAWMLGREAGAAHPGPILTGIAFSLCAQSTYRIYGGHVCFLDGYAWMPWVVVGVLRVLREPSKGTFARATAASGMLLLSGYPQLFYLTWFAIAVVAGVGALLSETPAARLGRLAAITLGIGALTALLGAASLVPALELLSDSNRAGFDPRFVSMISLAPENLLTFLMPRFFGDDLTIPYWGQAFIPECIFYVGIVPLVLAVRSARRKSRETVLPWLVLLEICLLMALGPRTPFFLPLARVLPGMGMFRGPAKFMWIFGLGMSVLAGLGMATVGEKRQAASAPGAPRKVTLRLAAGLAFALGLVALGAGCGAETLV
ncbi:MAG: hypothetical protein HY303_20725, partial [Candidatus Wallbacteria bacterium]|nr:hypothetical protein [Candidatus Wallbacteria bacterium]